MSATETVHEFGGPWTTDKLNVLAKYLNAYTTALKRQPFRTCYIDAFAGTGSRRSRKTKRQRALERFAFFPESDALLDGSARIALKTTHPFGQYVFVERSARRCRSLEALKADFPDLASRIAVRHGDANDVIRRMCGAGRNWDRAVLFLDPYALHVEWDTIVAIARTQVIDLWVLFPLMAVNRVLPRSGDVSEVCQRKLDVVLGTAEWRTRFYERTKIRGFFDEEELVGKASLGEIGAFFQERLGGIFAGVAEPGVLRNRSGSPLFLLSFAVGNPGGKKLALKIATDVLKELR